MEHHTRWNTNQLLIFFNSCVPLMEPYRWNTKQLANFYWIFLLNLPRIFFKICFCKTKKKKWPRVKVQLKPKKNVRKKHELNIGTKCEMEFDDTPALELQFEQNHTMALRLSPLPPLDNSFAYIQRQLFEDK